MIGGRQPWFRPGKPSEEDLRRSLIGSMENFASILRNSGIGIPDDYVKLMIEIALDHPGFKLPQKTLEGMVTFALLRRLAILETISNEHNSSKSGVTREATIESRRVLRISLDAVVRSERDEGVDLWYRSGFEPIRRFVCKDIFAEDFRSILELREYNKKHKLDEKIAYEAKLLTEGEEDLEILKQKPGHVAALVVKAVGLHKFLNLIVLLNSAHTGLIQLDPSTGTPSYWNATMDSWDAIEKMGQRFASGGEASAERKPQDATRPKRGPKENSREIDPFTGLAPGLGDGAKDPKGRYGIKPEGSDKHGRGQAR